MVETRAPKEEAMREGRLRGIYNRVRAEPFRNYSLFTVHYSFVKAGGEGEKGKSGQPWGCPLMSLYSEINYL